MIDGQDQSKARWALSQWLAWSQDWREIANPTNLQRTFAKLHVTLGKTKEGDMAAGKMGQD